MQALLLHRLKQLKHIFSTRFVLFGRVNWSRRYFMPEVLSALPIRAGRVLRILVWCCFAWESCFLCPLVFCFRRVVMVNSRSVVFELYPHYSKAAVSMISLGSALRPWPCWPQLPVEVASRSEYPNVLRLRSVEQSVFGIKQDVETGLCSLVFKGGHFSFNHLLNAKEVNLFTATVLGDNLLNANDLPRFDLIVNSLELPGS